MWSEYRKNANFRSISEFSQSWRVILIPCGRRRRRQRRRRKEYIVDWFIGIHARTGLEGGGGQFHWMEIGRGSWIYVCRKRLCAAWIYEYLLFHVTKKSGRIKIHRAPIFRHCLARRRWQNLFDNDHTPTPRGGERLKALMKLSRNSTGWLPGTRFTFDLNCS